MKNEKPSRTYTKKNSGEKYVLGLGCSLTNPEFVPIEQNRHPEDGSYEFPKWTEIVAKHLNLGWEVWAENGTSNEKIFNRAVKYLATDADNIELLCVAWTDWERFAIWGKNFNLYNANSNQSHHANYHEIRSTYEILVKEMCVEDSHNLTRMIRQNLEYVYTLQELCKSLNVKFIFFTSVSDVFGIESYKTVTSELGYTPINEKKFLDMIINEDMTFMIDAKHYIDFPKFKKLIGGKETILEEKEFFVIDGHANEFGHEVFAKSVIRRYEKIYGRK
jgi:peroxiredoxin family protein